MVHLYFRPDGSIGGSGKPDPKWLFEDGVIYIPCEALEGARRSFCTRGSVRNASSRSAALM